MIAKLTFSAAALAATLIAAPVMAQVPAAPQAPAGAAQARPTPPMNPNAYNAIDGIRKQWEDARANYLRAQQAEVAARNNFDRMNTQLLNVLSATAGKPPTSPMPTVAVQQMPPQGQPMPPQGQPQTQPPRP